MLINLQINQRKFSFHDSKFPLKKLKTQLFTTAEQFETPWEFSFRSSEFRKFSSPLAQIFPWTSNANRKFLQFRNCRGQLGEKRHRPLGRRMHRVPIEKRIPLFFRKQMSDRNVLVSKIIRPIFQLQTKRFVNFRRNSASVKFPPEFRLQKRPKSPK